MPPHPPEAPVRGRKHRVLLRIERFSRQHYRVVFLLAALALVGGSWLGSKLKLESNILALIPEGNRQVDTLREALIDFGSIDYLVVLVEASEDQGPDELEEFANAFAERLIGLDALIEQVDYRFELSPEMLDLVYRRGLLFVPPERLGELRERLSDDGIAKRLAALRANQSSPLFFATQDLSINDPLDLMSLILGRLEGARGLFDLEVADGYYFSSDHQTLIMLVKPVGPSQDLDFAGQLMDAVYGAEAALRAELAADDPIAQVGVRYGGNYAIAVDEAKLILKDVKQNLVLSLVAVSLLYWLCYRRFAALLYSSLPLLVGQALTFALCWLVLGGLNASSSAFTALLMGLGTDFVIVVYARYVEERRSGKSLSEATELMIGETGLGVFTGAITSAGTFYAMCYSQFRGLRDLGFLIGSGILLCAIAILFMLPAMIKWNEGVRRRKVDSVKKLHLQSFMLEHLIPFSARNRKTVLFGVALLTVTAGWFALQLELDDSVNVLRSNRSESLMVQEEISAKFGASLSYMMAIASAPTSAEALELTEKIDARLREFQREKSLGSSSSILTYLPPSADQRQILDALKQDATGAYDAARVRATFVAELERHRFNPEPFRPFLDRLEGFLNPERPITLDELQAQGLGHVLERFVANDGHEVRIVTYLFLSDAKHKRDAPAGLVEALSADDPGIVVTGTNIVGAEFRRIFSIEAPRAVLIGLVVVFALLWLDFRSLRLTAVAMSQLICGVILMLGLMKVAGIQLNYVNAFVATMILGVGIDYSIHLVHRLSLSGGRITPGLLETGKAVVMAALTNIAGFGTLATCSYPALRSFGIVALFGSITCLFTALTLVPAVMGRPETTDEER